MRVAAGFAAVYAVLTGVFLAAQWHAERVSVPRYCDDPSGAVTRVGQVLADPRPAGAGPARGHAIAAKLLFLIPRKAGEGDEAYLARLRAHIEGSCR